MLNRYLLPVASLLLASSAIALQLNEIPFAKIDDLSQKSELSPHEKAEYSYLRGVDFLSKKKPGAAEIAFEYALKTQPSYFKAMLGLAEIAFLENNLIAANKWVKQALELKPNDVFVQNTYGRLLYLQKHYEDAKKAFEETLNIDSKNIQAHLDLAELLSNVFRDYEAAIFHYKKAIEIDSKHAGAQYGYGVALFSIGKNKESKLLLEQVASLDLNNPIPYFTLGNVYKSERNDKMALIFYQKAIDIDPQFEKAYMARSDIFIATRNFTSAKKDLQQLIAKSPKSWRGYLQLAVVHDSEENIKEAEKFYRKAIDLNNSNALAYNNLAWLIANIGEKYEEAERLARHAVKLFPDNPAFRDTLGWILLQSNKPEAALKELTKATELNPNDIQSQIHLGQAYQATNQGDKAREIFNRVQGN